MSRHKEYVSKRLIPVLLLGLAATPAGANPGPAGASAGPDEPNGTDEPNGPDGRGGSSESRRIDAGVFVGGNYFSSQLELGNSVFDDQVPESAFLLGLRGAYVVLPALAPQSSLGPQLSVELEGKLAFSSTEGMTELGRDSFFAPVLGWRAQARLSIWNQRPWSPFAVLGVGGETALTSSPFMASADTDAAMYWGLGTTYRMAPRYGLRGDFRHGLTAGRTTLLASTAELHVGFYYSFELGGSTHVNKVAVKPPPEPAPAPKPEPPADKDGDGFPDWQDACPDEAELRNGIEDDDGCPELDKDNDGLFGSRDQCPDEAEDMDGFEDENGCPDPDNDGDGRLDVSDACPLEVETLNGFEDDDGCPDEVPAQVVEYTGVIQGIRFQTGSARILRSSNTMLDRVVVIMTGYPSIRVRISGHTDNRGKPERNLELSQQRAEAVKAYLVSKGIDASRLETVGYGPDKPIADNKSSRGRAQNRRIEFELLPGPAVMPDPRQQPAQTK